ncbi:hypothetical protein JRQ81_006975 [Phrynocephalus forsythii]|uniref:Uncharacterized protein n=1 Tax=Phrynocephalus forsythii TaxID=171643 RepID=A0A9Q1AUG8_9SAUR|nr:hypothetical protein JRQ81_006975 [Phrynocephalus forsythii]
MGTQESPKFNVRLPARHLFETARKKMSTSTPQPPNSLSCLPPGNQRASTYVGKHTKPAKRFYAGRPCGAGGHKALDELLYSASRVARFTRATVDIFTGSNEVCLHNWLPTKFNLTHCSCIGLCHTHVICSLSSQKKNRRVKTLVGYHVL